VSASRSRNRSFYWKPKNRKLDAAAELQAIADAQWLIKRSGGLSHEYSRDYWRFSTKAELRGWVETGDRFVQGIKDALGKDHGEVSISFLPGPMTWNPELAAKLIADAKQGDTDADQVLREVAAEFLTKRIPLPNELADHVVPCLQANSSTQSHKMESNSNRAHKTEYRDWILALTVDVIVRRFNLKPTRNRETLEHCACSIVALAADLHENTVKNAWDDYKRVADQPSTNYVPQAVVSVTYDDPQEHILMRPPTHHWRGQPARPRVVDSDGTQEHFLLRFPRVGSPEAMAQPSNRKAQRAKRAQTSRLKRTSAVGPRGGDL
jgi:hypothetical protein